MQKIKKNDFFKSRTIMNENDLSIEIFRKTK